MSPTLIHVREWDRTDPQSVYIGRTVPRSGLKASPWANPYTIGRDGNRENVLWWFNLWVRGTVRDMTLGRAKWMREHLDELAGKKLVCYCAPKPCHGDILITLLEERIHARTP